MGRPRSGFLVDANVLIDYRDSDLSVLDRLVEHIAPVYVLEDVAREVLDIGGSQYESLGIRVVSRSDEEKIEASLASREHPRLSFEDHLGVRTRRREGWTCLSNDQAVRRACRAEGVRVLWGLEVMLLLVEVRVLAEKDARTIARRIRDNNPAHITDEILVRFEQRLNDIRT